TDPDSDTFTWQITAPNETAVTAMSGTPAVSNGTYGTLSLNDDGSWSYTLDDTLENALLDALDAGERRAAGEMFAHPVSEILIDLEPVLVQQGVLAQNAGA
ncbi:VCBS domain-containing protein, partial [Mycolicibacterium poriferae]|uniref:VCBS domain-containing protein n=1 Tax=Mycolicibacterium poriferae TaxID=39694 RepID=UPI0024BA21EA